MSCLGKWKLPGNSLKQTSRKHKCEDEFKCCYSKFIGMFEPTQGPPHHNLENCNVYFWESTQLRKSQAFWTVLVCFLLLSRRSFGERSMVPTVEIFTEYFTHCKVLQKEDGNIFHLWTLWVWQWVTVSTSIFWFYFWNLKSSCGFVTNHAETLIGSRENIKIGLS